MRILDKQNEYIYLAVTAPSRDQEPYVGLGVQRQVLCHAS